MNFNALLKFLALPFCLYAAFFTKTLLAALFLGPCLPSQQALTAFKSIQ